jgi:alanyl-tRNA synthetase
MTGHELRQSYLDFFRSHNSLVVPSSSLVPTDPTTLLTSAGMQPLVPYFKGEETPPSTRLASCQKCCRADDIEQVGVTWRHASFFEMLGNFSFGDYFKREAIVWGWDFLTKTLNIDPKLLYVSVYLDDQEAPQIWKNDVGLSDDRILRMGKKDNWWGPVGKSGPCGPDSEIFLDRGAKYDTGDPEMDRPGGDGDRYGELWNLVFQQYNQQEDGSLPLLPAPGIDTGMGLERTAAVLQGVDTIHHTDLFAPLINAINDLSRNRQIEYSISPLPLDSNDPTTKPLKIIADHVRSAIFMAGDGIVPGNNGRDYMMRRFIRRAFLTGRQLDLREPFLHTLVPIVSQGFGDVYPEVRERAELISGLIQREEEAFGKTLGAGINRIDDLLEDAKKKGNRVLDGEEVFRLYETYGFPLELTQEMAQDAGFSINEEGYRNAQNRHSKISGSTIGEYATRIFGNLETQFVGYEELSCDAAVVGIGPIIGSIIGNSTAFHQIEVVLDRTPFYGESGGQVGDTGELVGDGFRATVQGTEKKGNTFVHTVSVSEGEAREGMKVRAIVNAERRRAVERAHSSTHLLHAALRNRLGNHVEQRGSLVSPDKLRFDFVHFSAISPDELRQIEDNVNREILLSLPVEIRETSLNEAKSQGAMALFGEKYGDVVRTVRMGDYSLELCGGTHLPNTSSAGLLRIVGEGGVGSNLRRIEALTGKAALEYDREQGNRVLETSRALGTQPDNVVSAAEKMRLRVRELEKQLGDAQAKLALSSLDDILNQAQEIGGVTLIAARTPKDLNANTLREVTDKLGDRLLAKNSAWVLALASESEGRVLWAVKVGKEAAGKGAHAGNLIRVLATTTGGGGGGKADFAQAGGKDATKIDDALAMAKQVLQEQLKA